ncbi:MAG: sirohydrochlorin cobaltochelatase [Oscillospiraceae bacterium]|nr:sirohydrochlorin cobaltochelatase [Oscillospiraceae bacterium]
MNIHKLPALLLALVLALSLTVTALAAEEGTGYTDVAGTWSEAYVARVADLIDGRTETTFAPNENITRAELVTALYRLAGSPDLPNDAENPFADVAEDAAYRDAVVWASDNSIVGGRNAETFDPDGSAQRQEIAKILDLYAAQAVGKIELVSRVDDLSGYPDAGDVAGWAKSYMNWAVSSGFITGSGGKLDPKGTATRAQIAAILCRYMDDASTGAASADNPRNQDGIGENELLVVSFGTSFNDNRVATIGAIEEAMETAFPEYSVRRGFTANIIIEHIQRRDGEVIDDVNEALDRAKANGVKNLLVQPTHLMNGYEYGDLVKDLEKRAGDFESVKIGAPLLTDDEDFATVAQAMVDAASEYDDGKTAICYMGHGTEAASNAIYAKMQQLLTDGGHTNYFVGTVEAAPTLEDVIKLVQAGKYERVVLRPMMIVAGDHANNDMAGDEEDSWKSAFEANGFQGRVICEIKGLGELEAIQQLLIDHAREAKSLSETGIEVEPNPAGLEQPEEEKPAVADGTYTVEVESDSSMFRVVKCELTAADGQMTAVLTLSGTGYDQMFVGSKSAAQNASEGFIQYAEDAEGAYTFTVPVAALDTPLQYAAHGVKSGKWFDRTLTFDAASLQAK